MIDFFKELGWAIVHDNDTKITLSIAISIAAITISVCLLIAR